MTVTEENTASAALDSEPTIVETLEDAAFILEENPDAAILIRRKMLG